MSGSGQSPYSFASGGLLTKEEKALVQEKLKSKVIGIPKEDSVHEHRVALIPHSIRHIVGKGHKVLIERGAGVDSNYQDIEYSEAGAEITEDKKSVFESNIVVKVSPPTLEEIEYMGTDQMLICPLQIPCLENG